MCPGGRARLGIASVADPDRAALDREEEEAWDEWGREEWSEYDE